MARLDLTGKKINRLTVIKEVGRDDRKQILWLCKCDCGNETIVTAYRINKGITKSCGCLLIEKSVEQAFKLGKNNKTHGMSKSRLYKTYRGMIDRCFNQNDQHYPDYGGRGISICNEWRADFINFYNWSMGNGYSEKLTIDRIDVNGNYEPDNCRWVTSKEQGNNKRNNKYIEHLGEVKTLSQWAETYGLKRVTLAARLDRYRMSFEEAVSMEGGYDKPRKMYKVTNTINDVFVICSRKEIMGVANISVSNIRYYLDTSKLWKNKYKIETHLEV